MSWRLLTALGYLIGIGSVVFAAPQDTAAKDIIEYDQQTSITESTLTTEEAQITKVNSAEETSTLSDDNSEGNSQDITENVEENINSLEDSEIQEIATQRDEPIGNVLSSSSSTATPLVEGQSINQNLDSNVSTQQQTLSSSNTPATITITRPTKKPNKKPKPVRTTIKPLLQNNTTANLLGRPITEQTNNEKPAVVETATQTQLIISSTYTPATIVITRPTKKPTKKPKPVRATTVKPVVQDTTVTTVASIPSAPPVSSTSTPTRRYPCRCGGGVCSCCTGIILENFNFPFRSRACANVSYEPDEFAFNLKLAYNDRVLYNTRMSAKNPPPACIPINRYFGIKMCAKLTNVFFSGRNVHACLEMEGIFDDEPAFNYPFNCFRIGSNGVAFVRPEDGGGLPPPPDEEEQVDEDYDDNARGWVGDVQTVPI